MLTMVEYVHQRISTYPRDMVGVDMTMGNGHDTKYLLSHCQKVYAFDIQEEAFINTQKKIGFPTNLHYIHDSHENIDKYFSSFDIGIFNLGYLPLASHQVTTLLSSTKVAIQKSVEMMTTVLFIVVYPGHEEGVIESQWIQEYVSLLDTHVYNVSCYCMMNKKNAPYVIEIEKRKK